MKRYVLLTLLVLSALTLSAQSRSLGVLSPITDKGGQVYNVLAYGAKCDGLANDTTAINTVIADACAAASSGGTTAEIHFPAGTCLGNFTVVDCKGIKVSGSGELSTILQSPNSSPAMQINGLWYSRFSDMSFQMATHSTTNGALEIDGDYDGTHTQTVQFITFENILAGGQGTSDGLLSNEAVGICRQGASNGCMGSNMTFINDAFSGAYGKSPTGGVVAIYGFNALGNQFIGGDIQNYTGDGIAVIDGGIQNLGMSFETTHGCAQMLNGGWDVNATNSGAGATLELLGNRTEGWNFSNNTSAQKVYISGFTQSSAWAGWSANGTANLNDPIKATDSVGRYHMYCVTTPGTYAATQALPWPASGTVTNGTATLTEETDSIVNIQTGSGTFDYGSSTLDNAAEVDWGSVNWSLGSYAQNFSFGTSGTSLAFYGYSGGDDLSVGNAIDIFLNNITFTSPATGHALPIGNGLIGGLGYDFYLGSDLVEHWNSGTQYFTIGKPFQISEPLISTSAAPTITGCGTVSSQVGGGAAGTFVTSGTSCTPVLTGLPATLNGYACMLWDQTHSTTPMGNLSSTTTSATFGTITTTAGDTIAYQCGLSF